MHQCHVFELRVPVNAIQLAYNSLLGPGALLYVPYSSPIQALRLYIFKSASHALILETALPIEKVLIMEMIRYFRCSVFQLSMFSFLFR